MYNSLELIKPHWNDYSDVLNYWHMLRQDLIVEYAKITSMADVSKKRQQPLPSEQEISDFFASLVDYISAGHFKIYNMILDKWKEAGLNPTRLTDALYSRINLTTGPLLEINDKYVDSIVDENNCQEFVRDLSIIGELMEQRFELEDRIIQQIVSEKAAV
ncbi:MAG: sigma D regulator [Vibrionaceae bacterium]